MIFTKIYSVLGKKEKISIIFLLFISLINIFVDTLTIGSIIPLITSIISFERIEENYYVVYLTQLFFDETNKENFLILLSYVIIFLVSTKITAEILIVNFKSRIQNDLVVYFQINLLKKFISEDWSFHLKNDASVLIRQITTEVGYFVSRIILPTIENIIETLLILSFFTLLLIYNYKLGLIIFSLIISILFLLNLFSRKRVKSISSKRYNISIFSFKAISEIFIILKEIIISSLGDARIQKFTGFIKKYYTYERLINIYNILPKLLFEFFAILFVCIAIIFYTKNFQDYLSLLVSLGLYMATAVRVIPSVTKVARNLQYIELGKPAFEAQFKNLIEIKSGFFESKKKVIRSIQDKIEFRNISFSYDKKTEPFLKNIDLELKKNQIICIKGESGSGKSTIANIIMGIIKPDSGEIFLDKKKFDFLKYNMNLKVGYVDQVSKLLDDTLQYNITFKTMLNKEEFKFYQDLIKKCGLEKFSENIKKRIDKNIGEDSKFISGGEKQRISIARTLFRNPELIIFDEPTSSLDMENEEKIMNLIKQFRENRIIVVITHNSRYFSQFDKIYSLEKSSLKEVKS